MFLHFLAMKMVRLRSILFVIDVIERICPDGKIRKSLFMKDENNEMHETGGSIELSLVRTDDAPGLDSLMSDTDDAASVVKKKGKTMRTLGKLFSGTSAGTKGIEAAYDIYRPLLKNIAIVVRIVDGIADVIKTFDFFVKFH
jgi:hypothetical protein